MTNDDNCSKSSDSIQHLKPKRLPLALIVVRISFESVIECKGETKQWPQQAVSESLKGELRVGWLGQ